MENTYKIRGKVISQDGNCGVKDLLVESWDKDLLLDGALGSAKTDENGNFSINLDSSKFSGFYFDKKPDIFFKVYYGGKFIYDTKNNLIWNADKEKDVEIKIYLNQYVAKESVPHTIIGNVLFFDGHPVSTKVEVFAIGLKGEVLLGNSKSDDKGNYSITFKAPAGSDIRVKAYIKNEVFAESDVYFEIGGKTVINLRGIQRFRGPSVLERISKRIDPHLNDTDLSTLSDDNIRFLAGKTETDINEVNILVEAKKFETDKIPSSFYYTIFKSGISPEPSEIYRVNVHKALELFSKVQGELIPENSVDIETMRLSFIDSSVQHILNSGSRMSASTMNEMLSLSLEDVGEKKKFVELYFHSDPKNDIDAVWNTIENKLGEVKTKRLRLDGKLGYLTINNAPLIAKIKRETRILNDLVELVKNGFYRTDTLGQFIDESIAIPEIFKGENDKEKRDNYIKWINGQLQFSYPNEILIHQIENEEIAINTSNKKDVQRALAFNSNGFKIGEYSINQHIKELQDSGQKISLEAQKELKALHRVYSLAPNEQSMNFLIKNKLDSSFKIIEYSERQFGNLYTREFEEEEAQAMMIYNKAQQNAGLITNLAIAYGSQKS